MNRNAQTASDVHAMADEVAGLMAERLGGTRRGEAVRLQMMLRRRGGALPRKIRRAAQQLADLDARLSQPKIARQTRFDQADRLYARVTNYLLPLGEIGRWRNRGLNFAASVVFGLMLLGAVVIWLLVRRGYI